MFSIDTQKKMKQLWQNVKNCNLYDGSTGVVVLFPSFKNTIIFHNKKCLSGKRKFRMLIKKKKKRDHSKNF